MFSNETFDDNKLRINPIQESPSRLSIYGINKCEDQVIGFEFTSRQYQSTPDCFSNAIINLCVPIEVKSPIALDNAQFWATDDPCYKDWNIKKIETPEIEIQRDTDNKVTGILVRFSKDETCCYPSSMAYRLYALDNTGCKFSLTSGLLIFR